MERSEGRKIMNALGRCSAGLVLAIVAGGTCGCGGDRGAGELHAQMVVLEREVEGLRESVHKLEEGEPILPLDAVLVSISDSLLKDFLVAQLPLEVEVADLTVHLSEAEVAFKSSPLVTLGGRITYRDRPALSGKVRVLGALEDIGIDARTGTLRASIAIDHIDLLEMGGIESLLSGDTLDDLARTVRLQLEDHIPDVQIPVQIEQAIELPDVTDGPVRLRGASLPLAVGVVDVFTGRGQLWVAVKVVPGVMVEPRAQQDGTSQAPADSDSPVGGRG